MDIAISMFGHGGLKSILNGLFIDEFLTNKKPAEPHYFLFAIGTRPAYQGQGFGGRLMELGLKTANADHMPAYLESSKERNVPFYLRYGFEVTEKIAPGKSYHHFG